MKNKTPKNLNLAVLARFMSPEDIESLMGKYHENKRSATGWGRGDTFKVELTKEDLELLNFYIHEVDSPLGEFAKDHQLTSGQVYSRVLRIAMRALAQLVGKDPGLLDQLDIKD